MRNLHSTMLLLYPACHNHTHKPVHIYIPLCFYFIIYMSNSVVNRFDIYIPLCFYFIAVKKSECITTLDLHSTMLLLYQKKWRYGMSASRFTFHYASTLSNMYLMITRLFLIYIPLCFYFILYIYREYYSRNKNLHSTMLLLYLIIVIKSLQST